jgi:hypothetical protein
MPLSKEETIAFLKARTACGLFLVVLKRPTYLTAL